MNTVTVTTINLYTGRKPEALLSDEWQGLDLMRARQVNMVDTR